MPQLRFNHVFLGLMALGLVSSLLISPSITDRAKGKEELLLLPVVKPVRSIAEWMHNRWGNDPLPPGETKRRADSELMLENQELRQQVAFLTQQLESLRLVDAELKRLGGLLDYFKPVTVIGGDATPGRESLSIMPASGISTTPGTPVMCSEGLVGKIVDGRRVRLITDKESVITGQFVRYENGKLITLPVPRGSVRGIGQGMMRIEHLTVKEAGDVRPGDWVVVADLEWSDVAREVLQGRQIGQVESVRPSPGKPLYAEIIIKPRVELKRLSKVLVMKAAESRR